MHYNDIFILFSDILINQRKEITTSTTTVEGTRGPDPDLDLIRAKEQFVAKFSADPAVVREDIQDRDQDRPVDQGDDPSPKAEANLKKVKGVDLGAVVEVEVEEVGMDRNRSTKDQKAIIVPNQNLDLVNQSQKAIQRKGLRRKRQRKMKK